MGSACHHQPQSGLCQDCSACVGSTGFRGTQDTKHWIGNEPCPNFPPFTEEISGPIFNNCVEKKQTTGKPYLRLDAAILHSTLPQGQRAACPQDSHQNSFWSQEKPRLGPRSTCFAFRGNIGSPVFTAEELHGTQYAPQHHTGGTCLAQGFQRSLRRQWMVSVRQTLTSIQKHPLLLSLKSKFPTTPSDRMTARCFSPRIRTKSPLCADKYSICSQC